MKEFLVFFGSKQIKTDEPIQTITSARNTLRNARKGSGRYFNHNIDYISVINAVELNINHKIIRK